MPHFRDGKSESHQPGGQPRIWPIDLPVCLREMHRQRRIDSLFCALFCSPLLPAPSVCRVSVLTEEFFPSTAAVGLTIWSVRDLSSHFAVCLAPASRNARRGAWRILRGLFGHCVDFYRCNYTSIALRYRESTQLSVLSNSFFQSSWHSKFRTNTSNATRFRRSKYRKWENYSIKSFK